MKAERLQARVVVVQKVNRHKRIGVLIIIWYISFVIYKTCKRQSGRTVQPFQGLFVVEPVRLIQLLSTPEFSPELALLSTSASEPVSDSAWSDAGADSVWAAGAAVGVGSGSACLGIVTNGGIGKSALRTDISRYGRLRMTSKRV